MIAGKGPTNLYFHSLDGEEALYLCLVYTIQGAVSEATTDGKTPHCVPHARVRGNTVWLRLLKQISTLGNKFNAITESLLLLMNNDNVSDHFEDPWVLNNWV